MEKSGDEHGEKAEIKSGQINEKSGIPLKNGDFTGLLTELWWWIKDIDIEKFGPGFPPDFICK